MIKDRGFTLVEAIAVITITGIIVSVVAIFVARPVEGYLDSARRAVLTDMADTSLRRIGRDVRAAAPNSVRVTNVGAASYLEFVPTSDGVRYRVEQAAGSGNILDFTAAADSSFDIFGVSPLAAGSPSYFLIHNTGQCNPPGCNSACTASGGADVYQGCNRRFMPAATATSVSFIATALPLPFDSPGHRLQTIPLTGPVIYACEGVGVSASGEGTGTLMRYDNYCPFHNGPVGNNWNTCTGTPPAAGTHSLLADSVSACTITYVSSTGVTQRDGLVVLRLTLTRANESVTLYHEVHVDNQP